MLGAVLIAATAGPAVMGALGAAESAVAGMGTLRPQRAAAFSLCLLSLAGVPPLAGFFGQFAVAASVAGAGHLELVAAGLLGTAMSVVAAIGTVRAIYLANPLDESRRAGFALPAWTRLSAGGAVALAIAIAADSLFANPVISPAFPSAAGLGLRQPGPSPRHWGAR